jgi:hypothetical protein
MAHGNPTSQAGRFRVLALVLALAAPGAWAMGESPPEGRESPPAAKGACPEQKAGAGAGSAGAACGPEKPREPSQPEGKAPASRPDRYGTGYEARKGLGGGARGRGGGRGR